MKRFNRIIELLEMKQPVYYVSTSDLTYENGLEMAKTTWADYIRIDLQHSPLNMAGAQRFMEGVRDAGETSTGHPMCPVIAEVPTDGISEDVIRANGWQIRQLLACGVHGLLLCHAETPGAVRAFVEHARFASHKIGVVEGQLGLGRRGVGGHEAAAKIWGLEVGDYMEKADVWPLNPDGELILGIKMENKRALENCEETSRVPGVCFAEWGLADMSNNFGYHVKPDYPLPDDLVPVRQRVWDACQDAGVRFLQIATKDTYKDLIDDGLAIIRVYDEEVAELGKAYTRRPEVY